MTTNRNVRLKGQVQSRAFAWCSSGRGMGSHSTKRWKMFDYVLSRKTCRKN